MFQIFSVVSRPVYRLTNYVPQTDPFQNCQVIRVSQFLLRFYICLFSTPITVGFFCYHFSISSQILFFFCNYIFYVSFIKCLSLSKINIDNNSGFPYSLRVFLIISVCDDLIYFILVFIIRIFFLFSLIIEIYAIGKRKHNDHFFFCSVSPALFLCSWLSVVAVLLQGTVLFFSFCMFLSTIS